jgi:hypothetical protein
LDKTDKSFNDR